MRKSWPNEGVVPNKNKNGPISNLNKIANFVTWDIQFTKEFFIFKMPAVST